MRNIEIIETRLTIQRCVWAVFLLKPLVLLVSLHCFCRERPGIFTYIRVVEIVPPALAMEPRALHVPASWQSTHTNHGVHVRKHIINAAYLDQAAHGAIKIHYCPVLVRYGLANSGKQLLRIRLPEIV